MLNQITVQIKYIIYPTMYKVSANARALPSREKFISTAEVKMGAWEVSPLTFRMGLRVKEGGRTLG